jgi:2,4-dienoyl-CoA reductase-like NADH-dependent reductase (Old Yellow Enzyme family)
MDRAFQDKILGASGVRLKNVFIKAATYEGMVDQGLPTPALTDHHVAMAKGGVALTTVSYGAVSDDGRTFPYQLHIHDKSLAGLEKLAERVHQAGGKVSMQLTHCGYFTRNTRVRHPLAPSRLFNPYGAMSGILFSREMNRQDMDGVSEAFAMAALRIKRIGFDAVEVHMGHGYLLSQFLSPVANKRRDAYGGSVENRSRFPLEVLNNVVARTGTDFPVLVKLNLSDGFTNGFTLKDCKYVAGELEKLGCTALVLSGGFTSRTPFYLMRGKVPLWGMIKNSSNLAERLTLALLGPLIIRKYRFEENFFLEQARVIRKAVNMPLVYLGGVDSRKGIEQILDTGFDFIAMARPLIHDPDFLLKLREGSITRSACTRCNQCIVEMDRKGVRCIL